MRWDLSRRPACIFPRGYGVRADLPLEESVQDITAGEKRYCRPKRRYQGHAAVL